MRLREASSRGNSSSWQASSSLFSGGKSSSGSNSSSEEICMEFVFGIRLRLRVESWYPLTGCNVMFYVFHAFRTVFPGQFLPIFAFYLRTKSVSQSCLVTPSLQRPADLRYPWRKGISKVFQRACAKSFYQSFPNISSVFQHNNKAPYSFFKMVVQLFTFDHTCFCMVSLACSHPGIQTDAVWDSGALAAVTPGSNCYKLPNSAKWLHQNCGLLRCGPMTPKFFDALWVPSWNFCEPMQTIAS